MADWVEADWVSRFQDIKNKISLAQTIARKPKAPTLIAVSKKQPVGAIEILYWLGHRDFGENYAQELTEKAQELDKRGCVGIRWHFIGHLQTNKIKMLMPYVFSLHTLDSAPLAIKVAQRWADLGRKGQLPVFIEVNLDQESSKSGVAPFEAKGLAESVGKIPNLSLQGLMCIPEVGESHSNASEALRSKFISLRHLEHECQPFTQGMLSMGMSNDFDIAIEEGATHVRVGSALFGPRVVEKLSLR